MPMTYEHTRGRAARPAVKRARILGRPQASPGGFGLRAWYSDAVDWVVGQAEDVYQAGQDASEAALANMRERYVEFESMFTRLLHDGGEAEHIGLGGQWRATRDYVQELKQKVDATIANYQSLRESLGLAGLGFGIAIAAVIVAGIVATLGYGLNQMRAYYAERDSRVAELVREGVLPPDALLDTRSVIGETGDLIKWAAIAGIAFFVAMPILRSQGILK